MFKGFKVLSVIAVLAISAFTLSSCTFIFQKGRKSDADKIRELKTKVSALGQAKNELDSRLSREIADKQVKVEMLERGLVITFVSEVLFDSGKAKLRSEALRAIDQVAGVLTTTVSDLNVGIEGHTDNVAIKHSGWKSNWELSSARALSVLEYLEKEGQVQSRRLSATGFGEHHPVSSNDSREGRQKNRRVEIVILPKAEKKGR